MLRTGWTMSPVDVEKGMARHLPEGKVVGRKTAIYLADAMSGGEVDVSALVQYMRPGSYHRSPGANRLHQMVRDRIFRAQADILMMLKRRGKEDHLGTWGGRN